ncbi:MAG: hypothetical protein R2707_04395 [Acidimicrobiales bacterium]
MRNLTRSVSIPLLLLLAVLAAACTVDVGATSLTVVQAQEDGFFENGDEPYVAVIKWRVIPGTPGSASAEFIGNLTELASGADDGAVLAIPSAMGAVTFENVQNSTFEDLLTKGVVPELVGTVMVVMESDLTPWGTINNLMNDVEAALEAELVSQVEPLTIAQLTDPQAVADALSAAAANVEAAVTPGVWDSILLFLGSLGNPDDPIDIGFTVWVAAYGPLGQLIENSLVSALPAGATGGVWWNTVDPITTTMRFAGDGAIYDVSITATTGL